MKVWGLNDVGNDCPSFWIFFPPILTVEFLEVILVLLDGPDDHLTGASDEEENSSPRKEGNVEDNPD